MTFSFSDAKSSKQTEHKVGQALEMMREIVTALNLDEKTTLSSTILVIVHALINHEPENRARRAVQQRSFKQIVKVAAELMQNEETQEQIVACINASKQDFLTSHSPSEILTQTVTEIFGANNKPKETM